MKKIRDLIANIAALIFLIFFLMKRDIPRFIYIVLVGIIMLNQVMDDLVEYKKTKNKVNLIKPFTFIAIFIGIAIFLIVYE